MSTMISTQEYNPFICPPQWSMHYQQKSVQPWGGSSIITGVQFIPKCKGGHRPALRNTPLNPYLFPLCSVILWPPESLFILSLMPLGCFRLYKVPESESLELLDIFCQVFQSCSLTSHHTRYYCVPQNSPLLSSQPEKSHLHSTNSLEGSLNTNIVCTAFTMSIYQQTAVNCFEEWTPFINLCKGAM